MYIFSSKYKLYALLYTCKWFFFSLFFALLFSLWQYFSHTAVHCLFIFNFSPSFFWQDFQIFFKICVNIFCICVFFFGFPFPWHVWSCHTCLLCNKALFSLRLWSQFQLLLNAFLKVLVTWVCWKGFLLKSGVFWPWIQNDIIWKRMLFMVKSIAHIHIFTQSNIKRNPGTKVLCIKTIF